ncbi:hypothetical protein [Agromyces sp. NPDC058110]|uniref:hypothetical protein n=1 Tax=Agromyces sp. NPDC058110 TaxID=3346345 RepID=UPI0036D8CB8F
MPQPTRFATRIAAIGLASIVALGMAGCAPGAAADEPTAPASPSAAVTTPTPTPTPTPAAVAMDPADVTTWVITTDGMGPIQRGVAYPEVIAGLPAFRASEDWCPWVVGLASDDAAPLTLIHPEGDEAISGVWVNGRPDESGALPASPSTEAGIRLGSTMDELSAAYPALETVNQTGPESYGYAVGDETAGYIDFLVEDDRVVLIGVQERAGVPKEFCG